MSNPFAYGEPQSAPLPMARTSVRLKRIGVLSSGIFAAVAGAVGGFLAGGILFLASLAGAGMEMPGGPARGAGVAFGLGAVIFMPVIYGFFGFFGGLINALLYNLVAGAMGGIEMEFGQD